MKTRQNPMAFDTPEQELNYYYQWSAGAEQQIKELEEVRKTQKDYIDVLGHYIKLLGDSLDAVFPVAAVHGYKESEDRLKRGIELRKQIKQALKK